jgi:hypothetical protein
MALVVYTAFRIAGGNFRKGIISGQRALQERTIMGYLLSHFAAKSSSAAAAASSVDER